MFRINERTRIQILQTLAAIEVEQDVRILFAVESGSRAWGFPSADSDYDVRFVYANRPDWYLAVDLESQRDVIERPISDELDVSGWDIRKALQLFRKSNPPLLEWLDSPIVYLDNFGFSNRLRELTPVSYSPISCMHHYFSMLKGNFREYLKGDRVRLKKYFYVLRPLLAVIWIERDMGIVPTKFQTLVERIIEDDGLCADIDRLIEQKMAGTEMDDRPPIPSINSYLEHEIERLSAIQFDKPAQKAPIEQLNQLFRSTIQTVF